LCAILFTQTFGTPLGRQDILYDDIQNSDTRYKWHILFFKLSVIMLNVVILGVELFVVVLSATLFIFVLSVVMLSVVVLNVVAPPRGRLWPISQIPKRVITACSDKHTSLFPLPYSNHIKNIYGVSFGNSIFYKFKQKCF
jgi:hypothetical protein